MTDKIEWVKLIITNWKTLVAIITMLASFVGWQETVIASKEKDLEETQQQVANVAKHYVKTVIVEKKDQNGEGCTRICTKLSKDAMRIHLKEFH